MAAAVHAATSGPGPLFAGPAHEHVGLRAIPAFMLLGLACGLLAVVVSKGLFIVEGAYRRLPIGAFRHPVMGALGFATIGAIAPRASASAATPSTTSSTSGLPSAPSPS